MFRLRVSQFSFFDVFSDISGFGAESELHQGLHTNAKKMAISAGSVMFEAIHALSRVFIVH